MDSRIHIPCIFRRRTRALNFLPLSSLLDARQDIPIKIAIANEKRPNDVVLIYGPID